MEHLKISLNVLSIGQIAIPKPATRIQPTARQLRDTPIAARKGCPR
jgi:hypothetical protein